MVRATRTFEAQTVESPDALFNLKAFKCASTKDQLSAQSRGCAVMCVLRRDETWKRLKFVGNRTAEQGSKDVSFPVIIMLMMDDRHKTRMRKKEKDGRVGLKGWGR